MAEIRHAVTWCRRLLHLRARGFADVAAFRSTALKSRVKR
jgi:hypothetical protein